MSNTQEIDNQDDDRNTFNAALEDEVRDWFYKDVIDKMDEEALRQCQNVFIELIGVLRQDPQSAHRLEKELILWLEEVFKHSPAYQTAFELYASLHIVQPKEIVIEGNELGDMLKQIMEKNSPAPRVSTFSGRTKCRQQRPHSARLIARYRQGVTRHPALEDSQMP